MEVFLGDQSSVGGRTDGRRRDRRAWGSGRLSQGLPHLPAGLDCSSWPGTVNALRLYVCLQPHGCGCLKHCVEESEATRENVCPIRGICLGWGGPHSVPACLCHGPGRRPVRAHRTPWGSQHQNTGRSGAQGGQGAWTVPRPRAGCCQSSVHHAGAS